MVARTRYRLPLKESAERKFAALRERFDLRVLATAADGRPHDDGVFKLVGRAPLARRAALLPAVFRSASGGSRGSLRPAAIVTQSPYEAALVRLGCPKAPIAVELHGDWRTATRLYGSSLRRVLAPVADRVGTWGIRRADAVRTISPFTSGLVRSAGVEPTGEFVAFVDIGVFAGHAAPAGTGRPAGDLRRRARALQEPRGAGGGLASRRSRVPGAELHLVGNGNLTELAESLVREGIGVRWDRRLEPPELAAAVDELAPSCCRRPPRACRGS